MAKLFCRHCGIKNVNRPKGLCFCCYYTPGVPNLYPSTAKSARRGSGWQGGSQQLPEPTDTHPGSPEKEAVLMERAALALHHPRDERDCASLAPDDALEDAIRQRLDDGQRPTDIARALACPRARVY